MKKPYRNAVRSKNLIRQAYFELLAEKPSGTVTVTDIVARADLTRNTFYAHYRDVSAILEEHTTQLLAVLEDALAVSEDPRGALHAVADFADQHRSTLLLLQSRTAADLSGRLKQLLRQTLEALVPSDSEVLTAAAVSGMVDLTLRWVSHPESVDPARAADRLAALLQA